MITILFIALAGLNAASATRSWIRGDKLNAVIAALFVILCLTQV